MRSAILRRVMDVVVSVILLAAHAACTGGAAVEKSPPPAAATAPTAVAAPSASPAATSPAPEINLALHKPYVLEPEPNYPRTTDPGDSTQLTDGKPSSASPMWSSADAVGWQQSRPISITLDLQQAHTIDKVTFHTGAGSAGVEWPSAIYVLASTDGVRYLEMGDLVSASTPPASAPGAYSAYTFTLTFPATNARYVRLMADRSNSYLFADEVEVFGSAGASTAGTTTAGTGTDARADETIARCEDFFWTRRSQRRAAAAVANDQQRIAAVLSRLPIGDADRQWLTQALNDRTQSAIADISSKPVLSSRLPLSTAHAAMFEIATDGRGGVAAWPANPWNPVDPLSVPGSDPHTLSASLMPGERRWLAFNVRNSSSQTVSVPLQLKTPGLSTDEVQVYLANWTGTDNSTWVAAELEPLAMNNVPAITLRPGITQQVLIQLSPAQSTRGDVDGSVTLFPASLPAIQIPLKVHLFKTVFPTAPSMHFGGWDYTDGSSGYAVTATNRSAIEKLLQQHAVDSPWATSFVMSWQGFDRSGGSPYRLNVEPMTKWLAEWPSAKRYRIFLSVYGYAGGMPISDPHFGAAVGSWATAWAKAIRSLGKSPDQFDLLLVDEPQTPDQAAVTAAWATAIRASGAGFRIWSNPIWRDPKQTPAALIDSVDTVSINVETAKQASSAYADWTQRLANSHKTLELYRSSGPARMLDPYSYYRLTPWRAFFSGASGVTFWSFTDTRGSFSDNEFAAHDYDYSPFFINEGDQVRSGKHLEAAVEGLEDAEYLRLLHEFSAKTADASARNNATSLLQAGADLTRELDSSSSNPLTDPVMRAAADEIRVKIGELLDSAKAN